MQVIVEQSKLIYGLFSSQKVLFGESYRKLTYIVTLAVDDGLLVYNTITAELILLENNEIDVFNKNSVFSTNEKIIRKLIEKWILVPMQHDDVKFARQFSKLMLSINKNIRLPYITNFKILPTTDCNARCFYCYELNCNRRSMSENTAHDVADFIEKKCLKNPIKLSWFGGEPLYNARAINIICEDLRSKGIEYESKMVSNAFLFNSENIENAVNLWNLKMVQITLDGTEKIYNRIKAFIYKDCNPFEIVVNNMQNLLDAGIAIQTRMNMDEYNTDDLFELADYLHNRFGNYKHFAMYAHLLFEDSTEKIKNRTDNDRRVLIDKFISLQKHFRDLGYSRTKTLNSENRLVHCECDNDNITLIFPNGELGKCQHYTDDHFYGSIYSNDIDYNVINEFKEVLTITDNCDFCALRQWCLSPKMCNSLPRRCDKFDKKSRLHGLTNQMLVTYKKYKNDSDLHIASKL